MLNRLKQFIAKSYLLEGAAAGRRLAALQAPEAGWAATDRPLLFAAKKRKKKKKAPAAVRPAPRKARRKHVPGIEPKHKHQHDQLTARADGFFGGLRDHFTESAYGGRDWGRLAIMAAAMLVVLYYSFSAGGYFVVKRGYGELVILYLLVMGLIFGLRARGRVDRLVRLEIGFFAAYTLWMLLSAVWSLSPAASITEFNRGILYLAGFLVFFLFMARRQWLGWITALFVVIVTVVAVDGLLLKVVPDVMADFFNIGDLVKQIVAATGSTEEAARLQAIFLKMDNFQTNRLSYPLTYWNAMVLMMVMAVPLALRGAADRMKPLLVRCYYAAVQVLFLAVVFFTFSRAGYLLAVFIATAYTLLAAERLRTALHAGLVALWAGILVVVTRQFLPAMVASQPGIDERVSQGHSLGIVILVLLAAAAAAQVVVARLEPRLTVKAETGRRIGIGIAGLAVVVVLAGFGLITASSGGPIAWFQDQLSGASQKTEAVATAEERIFSLQSERYDEYKVSLKTLADAPLLGTGSGTWEAGWLKERPYEIKVKDGHSWFFDSLAELGLVGTLLLVGFVAAFVMVSRRDMRLLGRTRERDLYAAVFIACLAMLLHSTIDWHWEMPVVALPFFMFAGALARYGILAGSESGEGAGLKDGDSAGRTERVDSSSEAAAGWGVWLLGLGCIAMMALTVLLVITETRHDSVRQRLNQADSLAASNMTEDAVVWYRDGFDIAAGARRYYSLDARLLIQMGDASRGQADIAADASGRRSLYDAAERDYLESLRLEPNNFETYQRLAEVYLRTSQLEKAADAARRARELNPLDTIVTPALEERVRTLGGF
ncbi:MAG: O-antigen ligase family protein [Thermoleophilia bacterium]